jgi:hypothetical protein
MLNHSDLLKNMPRVRAALCNQFTTFVHTTPLANLDDVRKYGLGPREDAAVPEEVAEILGPKARAILCLHPIGASQFPRGTREGPFITLALHKEQLPKIVGLDWSYCWPSIRHALHAADDIMAVVRETAHRYGSIVSYQPIPPEHLRVFCSGDAPAAPLGWRMLENANDNEIYSFND